MRLIAHGRLMNLVSNFEALAPSTIIKKNWHRCGRSSKSKSGKAITMENINPKIVKLQYAVRGPIVIRAAEIGKELATVRNFHHFILRHNMIIKRVLELRKLNGGLGTPTKNNISCPEG